MEECEKSEEEEEDNLDKVLLLRTTGEDGDIMSAARGSYGRPRLSCEQDTVMTPTSCEENPEDSNEILPPPPPAALLQSFCQFCVYAYAYTVFQRK